MREVRGRERAIGITRILLILKAVIIQGDTAQEMKGEKNDQDRGIESAKA